ncbi:hypothetical protein AAG570_012568, partial [Ranatra chinensis]
SQQASSSTSAETIHSIYCRFEIRLVIKFLTLHCKSMAKIHHHLVETYVPEVMPSQHVYQWVRSFKEGRTDTDTRSIIASVFWYKKGVLLVDFMAKGTIINAETYCTTIKKNNKNKLKTKGVEC